MKPKLNIYRKTFVLTNNYFSVRLGEKLGN